MRVTIPSASADRHGCQSQEGWKPGYDRLCRENHPPKHPYPDVLGSSDVARTGNQQRFLISFISEAGSLFPLTRALP